MELKKKKKVLLDNDIILRKRNVKIESLLNDTEAFVGFSASSSLSSSFFLSITKMEVDTVMVDYAFTFDEGFKNEQNKVRKNKQKKIEFMV